MALARAIVRHPAVYLMDEPLSNLDAQLRVQTRGELKRLQQELGTTTVYVTHDQGEAMTLGSRVALLRAGTVEQVGPPLELYRRPVTGSWPGSWAARPSTSCPRRPTARGRLRAAGAPVEMPSSPRRPSPRSRWGYGPKTSRSRAGARPTASLRRGSLTAEPMGNETIVTLDASGRAWWRARLPTSTRLPARRCSSVRRRARSAVRRPDRNPTGRISHSIDRAIAAS